MAIAAIFGEKAPENGCKNRLYWHTKEDSDFFVGQAQNLIYGPSLIQASARPPFCEAFFRSKSLRYTLRRRMLFGVTSTYSSS